MAQTIDTFWTPDRILLALVFVAGLLIGGFVTNNYIGPYLNGSAVADQNSLLELNARLDSRNDQLYNCLVQNNIKVEACGIGVAPKKTADTNN